MAGTSLHTWMAEMLDTGSAPGTVRTGQLAAWLIATGQLPTDPFPGIKGPAQRHPVVMPLSDDELRALIATCATPTHRPHEPLHHRRDEAIIRLMMETGIRAGELITLRTEDLDLPAGRITIRFGTGGRRDCALRHRARNAAAGDQPALTLPPSACRHRVSHRSQRPTPRRAKRTRASALVRGRTHRTGCWAEPYRGRAAGMSPRSGSYACLARRRTAERDTGSW